MDVLLLENARSRVVDAVVGPAVLDEEVRAREEGDVVLVVELAGLEPVVVELEVERVAVLDEGVTLLVRAPHEIL